MKLANNEAPAVLSGLDNELKRYIAEISAPSDVECGLTLARPTSSFHFISSFPVV